MSWYIGEHRFDQRATFWKIVEDKETYAIVSLGTSKEDKKESEKAGKKVYHNSNWSFCRFVGNAYEGLKELKEKDQIVIVSGLIDRNPYFDKDGVKQWPKNEKITIFAWKKYVPENAPEEEVTGVPEEEVEKTAEWPF
jgi:single-stranded DNA-binding protein